MTKSEDHILSEDEEDLALGIAMEEGKREGVASMEEKQQFEAYLFDINTI
ncbi:hypothetical protein DYBT9623_03444 [Dyadobacter sp. CECT 9623]|uniref:Uncharacterized protein n=1 Tax=Dyadobacter linearis TaxID=2823330 RepID=A0ABM8UTL9_9BACT|nr:hypothetical protein [Dyadobacter sp. CECT 9623]CAG5071415.1 hypothetical protein DYBT9623_03444 [Dyadobacter sp. CECT 9623]